MTMRFTEYESCYSVSSFLSRLLNVIFRPIRFIFSAISRNKCLSNRISTIDVACLVLKTSGYLGSKPLIANGAIDFLFKKYFVSKLVHHVFELIFIRNACIFFDYRQVMATARHNVLNVTFRGNLEYGSVPNVGVGT